MGATQGDIRSLDYSSHHLVRKKVARSPYRTASMQAKPAGKTGTIS